MKLSNFFKPNFPELLIFMSGVLIGMTWSRTEWFVKLGLFIVAMLLVLWSKKIRGGKDV